MHTYTCIASAVQQLNTIECSLKLYCSQLSLQCQKLLLHHLPDCPQSPSALPSSSPPSSTQWCAQLQQLEDERSKLLEWVAGKKKWNDSQWMVFYTTGDLLTVKRLTLRSKVSWITLISKRKLFRRNVSWQWMAPRDILSFICVLSIFLLVEDSRGHTVAMKREVEQTGRLLSQLTRQKKTAEQVNTFEFSS